MKSFAKDLLLSARAKWREFESDESGSILQMTGLSIIPLMLAAGVAIDTSRINFAHQKLSSALDAGALAAATMVNKPQSVMEAEAQKYLSSNFINGDTITIQSSKLTDAGQSLVFEAVARVPTTIMRLSGTNYVDITLSSTVVKDGSSLEVALIMDNTGSMAPYMTDLKTAAKDFVETVVKPANPPYYTKVAIVPYSRAVNVGTGAVTARGSIQSGTSTTSGFQNFKFNTPNKDKNNNIIQATLPITTCVSERTGAQKYTDASVASNKVGRVYASANNPCLTGQVQGLASDKPTLNTAIDAMKAEGSSAGQTGIAWGWYTLSPNFGFFTGASAPAAYGTEKLKKVAIIMSDGEYNSAYCDGVISGMPSNPYSGSSSEQNNCPPDNDSLNQPLPTQKPAGMTNTDWQTILASTALNKSTYKQSAALCAGMKNAGIEVYTIEFQLNSNYPDRVDLMKSCATDNDHRVTAADGPGLKAAFAKIATSLGDPRVAK